MAVQDALVLFLVLTWSSAFALPADVRTSRIVSGWEASRGQFPHQLSLRTVNPTGGVFACGGSLIHREWGLTAAHCTAGQVTLIIRAGALSLTQPEVIFETSDYYLHPEFIESMPNVVQTNDISLIKFNRVISFSDLIRPIRLQSSADKDKNYARVRFLTSGWGRTWTDGPSPEVLNWVKLTGISNFDCWLAYGGSPIIVDTTICARYFNVTSQSICQGDNGGPLAVSDSNGDLVQVGVASFVSDAGCHVGFPAGFVRVGYFHDWITEVTGINFDQTETTTTTPAPEGEESEEDDETEESESEESSESEDESSESSESNEDESGDDDNGNGDDNDDNGNGDEDADEDNGNGDDNGEEDGGNGDDNGEEDGGNGDDNDEEDGGNGEEDDGNGDENEEEADEARKHH